MPTKNHVNTKRSMTRLELTIDIGMIFSDIDDFATAIPPTALVTETAGVKIPSDMVKLFRRQSEHASSNGSGI